MIVEKLWHRKLGFVVVALLALLSIVALTSIRGIQSIGSKKFHTERSVPTFTQNLIRQLQLSSQIENPERKIISVRRLLPSSVFGSTVNLSEKVHIFEWECWGQRWILKTWSDSTFLSNSSLVWKESVNDSWVEVPNTSCFVRGTLEGTHAKSDAALNICDGLSGVIQVSNLVFLIEPLEISDSDGQQNFNYERKLRTPLSSGLPHYEDDSIPHVLRLVSQFSASSSNSERENIVSKNPNGKEMHVSHTTGSSYLSHHSYHEASLPDLLASHRRSKRFIFSRRHTIEVMVVVDQKMAHYHGKHVDQYVLTLMSVVSLIFRDSSIGNNIDIAVVEVVKPEGKSFAPKKAYENYASGIGKSAEEMLKMFCKWQKQRLKYNPEHPHKYDTALLITRENICRNPYTQRCDTLGLAELGTMCSRYASCAIVQDNGLSAAFTIAHELGHLLNMPHDNDDKCSPFRENETLKHMNVMSRMLDHNTLPWIWSNCSRYYLTEYFQAGLGDCLEDKPWKNKIVERSIDVTLAGELFSASQQCQYVFGKTSSICPYMPKCKRLWCTTTLDEKEGCRTQHMPWADGTPCDSNKWCLRGECEPKNRADLKKIDGMWGAWQPWSSCSRSCGVGVRKSERFCDSPKPRNGGHFCTGERKRYESCKLRDCSRGALDFRSQQCKQFNGKNFGLPDIPENVEWIPKYADRRVDSCKLFCQAHNSGFSYQLKEKVEDGTPCGPDSYDICVSGKCRVAGCDYVLNSTLKDDWCGVCNGDNSTCKMLKGSMKEVQPWGYSNVIVIPEGAARIEIIQKAYHDNPADDNYLALVDYETGDYLLNGNWVVTPFEKLVEFGGSLLEYTGSNQPIERINSTKPLMKKLLVQILSVGKLYPPYVSYSYSKSHQETSPTYVWKLGPWTECSRPCIGESEQIPYCLRSDTNARDADHYCNEDERPARRRKACSLACSVNWSYSHWSPCKFDSSKKCMKKRKIESCVTSANTSVAMDRCDQLIPVMEMECEQKQCPLWTYGDWAPCHCSGPPWSVQKRLFACYLNERPVSKWECEGLERPSEERECPCWNSGQWSECYLKESETTLELRRRIEEIYPKPVFTNSSVPEDDFDSRAYKRAQLQKATVHENPTHIPKIKCPRGVKKRDVTCGSSHEKIPEDKCNLKQKPSGTSSCQMPCEKQSTFYEPFLPPQIFSTHAPNSGSHYKTHSPRFTSEENAGKSISRKAHDKFKGSKGFSSGGFMKGGKKNILRNSLPTSSNYNPISYSNEISQHHFSDRLADLDSGEEEHNNLVKGRQHPDHHLWQTGSWSKCSKECGTGEIRRIVNCGGDHQACPYHLKPKDRKPCNTHLCTEWSSMSWGTCIPRKQNPCRGKKTREVHCRRINGGKVDPKHCLTDDRPRKEINCKISCDRNKRLNYNNKPRYNWKKNPWSSCSETCDGGVTMRTVTCIDTLQNQVTVHDDYCLRYDLPRPRIKRRCNKHPCPFRWLSWPWSQCSTPCGPGLQKRELTCHRVSPLGWVDPDPVDRGCSKRRSPPTQKSCNMGICTTGFFWVARPWKTCQAPCGSRGRQRRSVICVDFKGVRAQRSMCSRTLRPKRKQRCWTATCGQRTCREVRSVLGVTLDGEYTLLVAGLNMSIYCHAMNGTDPKEFLTLPAGEEGNFAEIYNKRLLRPDTCPFNGERNDQCHCVDDESGRAGLTTYSKVRVNTTSLTINTFDFTFARAVKGRLIAYGEAGDCYSMTQCPQGSFSINLAGTLLKVSERTSWIGHGNKAAHWINRLDESQRIFGKCGGYCGTCTPDPVLGLKLDVRILTDVT